MFWNVAHDFHILIFETFYSWCLHSFSFLIIVVPLNILHFFSLALHARMAPLIFGVCCQLFLFSTFLTRYIPIPLIFGELPFSYLLIFGKPVTLKMFLLLHKWHLIFDAISDKPN